MVIIYLFRHGRTALNASGLLRGHLDEPLDNVGQLEALRLASLFAQIHLDNILSSPLSRSLDTARAIARPHKLPVVVDPAFIDRDYGPWAGKSRDEVERRYGSLDGAPSGEIEAVPKFEHRVVTALKSLVSQFSGKTIAIVGHDAVNRAIIRLVCEEWQDRSADLPQPTGCWNRLITGPRNVVCDVVGAIPDNGIRPL